MPERPYCDTPVALRARRESESRLAIKDRIALRERDD